MLRQFLSKYRYSLLIILGFVAVCTLFGIFVDNRFENIKKKYVSGLDTVSDTDPAKIREIISHSMQSRIPPFTKDNVSYLCGLGDMCQGRVYSSPLPPCDQQYDKAEIFENDKASDLAKVNDSYWDIFWIEKTTPGYDSLFYGPYKRESYKDRSYSTLDGIMIAIYSILTCKK